MEAANAAPPSPARRAEPTIVGRSSAIETTIIDDHQPRKSVDREEPAPRSARHPSKRTVWPGVGRSDSRFVKLPLAYSRRVRAYFFFSSLFFFFIYICVYIYVYIYVRIYIYIYIYTRFPDSSYDLRCHARLFPLAWMPCSGGPPQQRIRTTVKSIVVYFWPRTR